jgi:Lrp/AsnC family transcriptional regulator for asnA, asnC and gidA
MRQIRTREVNSVRIPLQNVRFATDSLAHTPNMHQDGEMVGTERLDHVSRAIIEQLQQDGRRSYRAIGEVVGLSEAAVRQRVQRLQDSGVLQIVAVTDPMRVGFARAALVGVTVRGAIEPVAAALEAIDEVSYLVICAGGFDLIAEVIVSDNRHLLDVIDQRMRSIAGVDRTETFMYLKIQKQTYTWGTR